MKVSAIFISLVGLIGVIGTCSANPDYIELESFDVGQCVKVSYTAPPSGRTTVNLEAANGTIVLHADYRKKWGSNPSTGKPWNNVLILNSQIGGSWGKEQNVKKLFTTPGTEMAWKICAKDSEFRIVLNRKEIATYAYRTPVNTVKKVLYTNSGYDSVLYKLGVAYAEPAH